MCKLPSADFSGKYPRDLADFRGAATQNVSQITGSNVITLLFSYIYGLVTKNSEKREIVIFMVNIFRRGRGCDFQEL
jgi:hypothetical protein